MPLVARVQSPLFSPIFRLRYEATVPKATQALGHVDDAYWCPAFSVASLPDPEALRLSRKAAIAGGMLGECYRYFLPHFSHRRLSLLLLQTELALRLPLAQLLLVVEVGQRGRVRTGLEHGCPSARLRASCPDCRSRRRGSSVAEGSTP